MAVPLDSCLPICVFCFLLQVTPWISVQSTVTGPGQPIVAVLGKEITLPCDLYLEKNEEHMEIWWYRIVQSNVTYHDEANATKKQLIEYRGRFSLLKDDITKGNMALKIHQVRLSDEGEYQCVLQDGSIQQATTVELKVAAWGSAPQIDEEPLKDGEILLLCRSNGWYPKPQVGWKDIQGKSLPSLSESYSQDEEDLFQIETSLVVQANSTKDVFCSIWHPFLEEQKSNSFPPRTAFPFLKKCAWIIAFAIGLQILGLFILGCIYFIRRQCKAKENQSQNAEEKVALQGKSDSKKVSIDAGWRRARKHAEHITLDPATAHPILILSEDQSQVTYGDAEQNVPKTGQRFESRPCVMGSQGFTSGRHYWEVEVGTGAAWTLGVCKETVSKNGWIILSPEEGFWTMRLYKNRYEVLSNPLTPLPGTTPFGRIGVYLDYDVREVSFYNVTDRAHIYTLSNCSFSGTIYPFFWVSPGASLILPKVTRENFSLLEVPSDFNPMCAPGELSPTPN